MAEVGKVILKPAFDPIEEWIDANEDKYLRLKELLYEIYKGDVDQAETLMKEVIMNTIAQETSDAETQAEPVPLPIIKRDPDKAIHVGGVLRPAVVAEVKPAKSLAQALKDTTEAREKQKELIRLQLEEQEKLREIQRQEQELRYQEEQAKRNAANAKRNMEAAKKGIVVDEDFYNRDNSEEAKLAFCRGCPNTKFNQGNLRCEHFDNLNLKSGHPCGEFYYGAIGKERAWDWDEEENQPETLHPECEDCCHPEHGLCCLYLVGCIAKNHYGGKIDNIPEKEMEEARSYLRMLRKARGEEGEVTESNIFKNVVVTTDNGDLF